MYSKVPKVLHLILGKPIIQFVVDLSRSLLSNDIIIVVGRNAKAIKTVIGSGIRYVSQPRPLGTGDAAQKGIAHARYKDILILYGDVPLLQKNTVMGLIEAHRKKDVALSLLSCSVTNPSGYGRIIRKRTGQIIDIVEESDASSHQQQIKEVNAGIYFGSRTMFQKKLSSLTTDNTQVEYYLTDVVKMLLKSGKKVYAHKVDKEIEIMGVNTKTQLAEARKFIKQQWYTELMNRGVHIEDPDNTTIDLSVSVGDHVCIRPFSLIEGKTTIKNNQVIGPFTWIKDGVVMKRFKHV